MTPDSQPPKDFLVGDEVISVTLSASQIELTFTRDNVMIGGDFILDRPGMNSELFCPAKKSGSLISVWTLIGLSVVSLEWEMGVCVGKEIRMSFSDTSLLRILSSNGFRGTIIGLKPPPGVQQIEDF